MAATGAGIGPSSVIESLVSGSRHVDEFGDEEDYTSDSDGDVEEEVSYVTLDLGQIHPTLLPSCSTCRIAGLDTPTPYMQLGSTIFKGQHQTLIGTELYFTEQRGT
ncbi:hypothetical protein SISNIDRAFT_408723 [Sistotremastrum niveocremeum HHB9708]|uniref:Transcription factor TFIIIC triple barrel domain-containing protein n=1 Tax=Sistotremastrum niveocremeum HHB9708 TaxID=1314777 RepID=A0A164WN67_9AGAM|nr:hypothetical protein SISNIDRAFT_408723 [Sistotremastrum niveocremeum HHB9708]